MVVESNKRDQNGQYSNEKLLEFCRDIYINVKSLEKRILEIEAYIRGMDK